jgi:hypothetical protein
MSEEAPNEGQAVFQRRLREPTFHAQVPSELALKPLQLRLVHIRRRTRNNSILPERLQQITQRRWITPAQTSMSSEKRGDSLLVYFSRQKVSSLQPTAENPHNAKLFLTRRSCVPQVLQPLRERIDV